jgi:hypothetical protein
MAVPYSRAFRALALASGSDHAVRLPLPFRGSLRRLVINQISGNAEGYQFAIFDREDAVPGVADESECLVEGHELLNSAVHQLIDTVTVTAGTRLYANRAMDVPYVNHDPVCDAPPKTCLWLWLNPTGSGAKDFDIAVAAINEVG